MQKFIIFLIIAGLAAGVITAIVIPIVKEYTTGNASSTHVGIFSGIQRLWNLPAARRQRASTSTPPAPTPPPKPAPVPVVDVPKPPTPPPGFTADQLSPYYDKLSLGSLYLSTNTRTPSSFTVRGEGSLLREVSVTGWKIKGNRGGELTIPRAVDRYEPSGSAPETELKMASGTTAYFYSTKSAIGRNFRVNLCTGYLNDLYKMEPSLPAQCPSVNRDSVAGFSGACQAYIFSLGTCKAPTADKLNAFSLPSDAECRQVLDTLNYGGCYRKYVSQPDFFKKEWRVWLGSEFRFDRLHDQILLLDEKGLLVDRYVY